jgi:hypothetical protein
VSVERNVARMREFLEKLSLLCGEYKVSITFGDTSHDVRFNMWAADKTQALAKVNSPYFDRCSFTNPDSWRDLTDSIWARNS